MLPPPPDSSHCGQRQVAGAGREILDLHTSCTCLRHRLDVVMIPSGLLPSIALSFGQVLLAYLAAACCTRIFARSSRASSSFRLRSSWIVAGSIGAESKRVVAKVHFVDSFQDHHDRPLDDLVFHARYNLCRSHLRPFRSWWPIHVGRRHPRSIARANRANRSQSTSPKPSSVWMKIGLGVVAARLLLPTPSVP